MTTQQNFFVRPANENEISAFKKALSIWGQKQPGKVEQNLGDLIQVKKCTCCKVSTMQYDILVEERSRSVTTDSISKANAPIDAKVKFGVVDIWSVPTPNILLDGFNESTWGQRLEETAYYVPCDTCKESCKTACNTCDRNRQVPCVKCEQKGFFTCHNCKGQGGFSCSGCKGRGVVKHKCGVCHDGKINCDGCQGYGRFHHLQGAPECRNCGGTGKLRCPKCHGEVYDEKTCRDCNGNGGFVCETCRGDKILACATCSGSKTVECSKCDTARQISCTDCDARGGYKKSEMINFKTSIHANHYFLSPVEGIREKLNITVTASGDTSAQVLNTNLLNQACKDEFLQPYAHQFMQEIHAIKPKSTLREKFQILSGAFMQMDFTFEGQEYTAYVDYQKEDISNLAQSSVQLALDKNPLQNRSNKIKLGLEAEAKVAREARDHEKLMNIAQKAEGLGFTSEATSWKSQATNIRVEKENAVKKKMADEQARRTAIFVRTVKNPSFFVLPNLAWLLAGFFTPMAVHHLIIWNLLGVYLFINQVKGLDFMAPQKRDFIKKMLILGGVILAMTATIYFLNKNQDASELNNLFNKGAGL